MASTTTHDQSIRHLYNAYPADVRFRHYDNRLDWIMDIPDPAAEKIEKEQLKLKNKFNEYVSEYNTHLPKAPAFRQASLEEVKQITARLTQPTIASSLHKSTPVDRRKTAVGRRRSPRAISARRILPNREDGVVKNIKQFRLDQERKDDGHDIENDGNGYMSDSTKANTNLKLRDTGEKVNDNDKVQSIIGNGDYQEDKGRQNVPNNTHTEIQDESPQSRKMVDSPGNDNNDDSHYNMSQESLTENHKKQSDFNDLIGCENVKRATDCSSRLSNTGNSNEKKSNQSYKSRQNRKKITLHNEIMQLRSPQPNRIKQQNNITSPNPEKRKLGNRGRLHNRLIYSPYNESPPTLGGYTPNSCEYKPIFSRKLRLSQNAPPENSSNSLNRDNEFKLTTQKPQTKDESNRNSQRYFRCKSAPTYSGYREKYSPSGKFSTPRGKENDSPNDKNKNKDIQRQRQRDSQFQRTKSYTPSLDSDYLVYSVKDPYGSRLCSASGDKRSNNNKQSPSSEKMQRINSRLSVSTTTKNIRDRMRCGPDNHKDLMNPVKVVREEMIRSRLCNSRISLNGNPDVEKECREEASDGRITNKNDEIKTMNNDKKRSQDKEKIFNSKVRNTKTKRKNAASAGEKNLITATTVLNEGKEPSELNKLNANTDNRRNESDVKESLTKPQNNELNLEEKLKTDDNDLVRHKDYSRSSSLSKSGSRSRSRSRSSSTTRSIPRLSLRSWSSTSSSRSRSGSSSKSRTELSSKIHKSRSKLKYRSDGTSMSRSTSRSEKRSSKASKSKTKLRSYNRSSSSSASSSSSRSRSKPQPRKKTKSRNRTKRNDIQQSMTNSVDNATTSSRFQDMQETEQDNQFINKEEQDQNNVVTAIGDNKTIINKKDDNTNGSDSLKHYNNENRRESEHKDIKIASENHHNDELNHDEVISRQRKFNKDSDKQQNLEEHGDHLAIKHEKVSQKDAQSPGEKADEDSGLQSLQQKEQEQQKPEKENQQQQQDITQVKNGLVEELTDIKVEDPESLMGKELTLDVKYALEVDVTKDRIKEKDNVLNNDDYGHDLASVQALQRKHQVLELDLVALGDKVRELDEAAKHLMQTYPDQAEEICEHQTEINGMWTSLNIKADARKEKLSDASDIQKFFGDFRDLTSWINSMMTLVSSDELAKDVTGTQALLDKHQEHFSEINARKGILKAFDSQGELMCRKEHYASDEIKQRMTEMANLRLELEKTWENRRIKLDQCLELQLFDRDCKQAESWIASKETFFFGDTSNGDNLEILIRKHEDLERAINAQEQKINALQNLADKLIQSRNYDASAISGQQDQVLSSWANLKDILKENKSKLRETQTIQQLSQDADEMENWLKEKLQIVTDESYKDPTNTQSKYIKHQTFEAGVSANAAKLKSLMETGERQPKERKDAFENRLSYLRDMLEDLTTKSAEKNDRLKELMRQQSFHVGVKVVDQRFEEMEQILTSEDCGKDLASVQNLVKRHQLMEDDISALEDLIKNLNIQAGKFVDAQVWNTESILSTKQTLDRRCEKIKDLAVHRRHRLNKASTYHEILKDVEEEETWIKEEKFLVSSENFGHSLKGIEGLKKKHSRLEAEIENHQPVIQALKESVRKLIAESDNENGEIETRIEQLEASWMELKEMSTTRNGKLEQSNAFQQFKISVEKEESWIEDQLKLLSSNSNDLGDHLDAVSGLLSKHESLVIELQTHKNKCSDIMNEGESLLKAGDHSADSISRRIRGLEEKLKELESVATRRKSALGDNSVYLQFIWKTDAVDSWIADKETHLKSQDDDRDLGTKDETSFKKQERFAAGLAAFEKEGISTITTLKDQLLSAKHEQTPAIEARYNAVMARWQKLLADADDRKQKLLQSQDKNQQIEDLSLAFAKKASEFNSWYTSAEEDLTEPVHCKSVEEIKVLKEAHEQFKASLSAARDDFKSLESLDTQIKSFKVGPNPYTWFTMEALEETWNNLQKIIRDRDNDLEKELARQEENDQLRKQFARAENEFRLWLGKTRTVVMIDSGNPKKRLDVVKKKSDEVRSQRESLKRLEDLHAAMGDRLILVNSYTEHSTVTLTQQLNQLDELCMRTQHSLKQEIETMNRKDVSKDVMKEISKMFKQFDKEKSGKLDHQEFKSCLCALGYDLPMVEEGQADPEFTAILDIVDPNRNGHVSLQQYTAFTTCWKAESVNSTVKNL